MLPAPMGATDECNAPAGAYRPVIDHARCEGKRDCVRVCPYDVFEVRRIDDADFAALGLLAKVKSLAHRRQTAYAVRAELCRACGQCVKACPEKAIKLRAL
jgi:4Fe-4S ferredoxin